MNKMNNYDITVIYACHDEQDFSCPDFPQQTLDSGRIQILPVFENDFHHPRRQSLQQIPNAEGTYTILLNKNDIFDPSFLENMMQAAAQPDTAFSMPAAVFQLIEHENEYFYYKPEKDIRIDTSAEIPAFPLELHGLMIPTKQLKESWSRLVHRFSGTSESFDPAFVTEPEKQILLDLFADCKFFAYQASCELKYAFAREYDYQFDLRCMMREWYYASMEEFLLPLLENEYRQTGKVSLLLQKLALHMAHIRIAANLNNRNKYVIARDEVPSYVQLLSRIYYYIDDRTIVDDHTNKTFYFLKNWIFDFRLKRNDFSFYPTLHCTDTELDLFCGDVSCGLKKDLTIRINLIDYENGCLEIDGGIEDFFSSDAATIKAEFDGQSYPVTWNSRYTISKCFGVTYTRLKTFHASIPVPDSRKKRLLNFYLCTDTAKYRLTYVFPSHTSRFSKDFTRAYWKFGKYLSFWKKDGIHVIPANPLYTMYREVLTWRQMYYRKNGAFRKQIPMKVLNYLLQPYFSRQKIWLFLDKIYKGGDSSEYMYRYAEKQNDGIKKYYLLDPSCPDFKRMKKEGYRPLVRGSIKHKLIFLNADLVIASNSTVFPFNGYTFEPALPIRGDVHFGVACVQHGMSIQKIAVAQNRLRDNTKLYFCASKYEIENLSKPVYDYEGYDALKLTGVPRYDGLKDRAEKIILLSPTWRMNSAVPVSKSKSEGEARDYNPNFKETDYYRIYNGLINDPRLLESAKKYGYRIQYVLHPIVSPQSEDFEKNDYVEIIPSTGEMSYEKLFCEAALMVTDFSGVQFDFAYMRKPVVYLHHEDIPQHYEEGTFFYDTMGFGEICRTNEELIETLCRYMADNCQMPELYRKRADDFFHFSDHNNCARIYPIMLDYTNKHRNN